MRALSAALSSARMPDKALLQLAAPLRHDNTALQQKGSQVVDERGSLRHQTFPRAMQRLHVELRLALHLDKAHVGRVAASAIASASRSSFFCAFT